ncbi:MAG: homocysteine S-methyltransferase family protein [Acidimicrobiales bacterium]|nr:homocysteine S-methyltransferase family protein [Acidimicrobiales bacterium]
MSNQGRQKITDGAASVSPKPSAYSRLLSQRPWLVIDGAMGTQLFSRGLLPGSPPEQLNLENPEIVEAVHTEYLRVGSDIILTNTFGGTRQRLALHGLEDKVYEINSAAARIARRSALKFDALVAGSIGPLGQLLDPLGPLSAVEARDAFREQIIGLTTDSQGQRSDNSVDLLWIETMSSLEEATIALEACCELSDLPVAVTMSFDTNRHTMMGVSPAAAVTALLAAGASAVGLNCGNSLADNEVAIREMREAAPDATLIAKPNAGIPEWKGAELTYSATPVLMAEFACRLQHLGVRLIGGCCGSTPDHILAMRSALLSSSQPSSI